MRTSNSSSFILLIVLAIAIAPSAVMAQTWTAPQTCVQRQEASKRRWAQHAHTKVATTFHNEGRDIADPWCRFVALSNVDSQPLGPIGEFVLAFFDGRANARHELEETAMALFTGDGIHPAFGGLPTGSGFAAGANVSLSQELSSRPLRLTETMDVRFASAGSHSIRADLKALGSDGFVSDNRHRFVVVSAQNEELSMLSYFGIGNASNATHRIRFALSTNDAEADVHVPVAYGFAIGGIVSVISFRSSFPTGIAAEALDVLSEFPLTQSALTTTTNYFAFGGDVSWSETSDSHVSTHVTGRVISYLELHGLPSSFTSVQLPIIVRYAPSSTFGSIALSTMLKASFTRGQNAVPFYLQPTIGGTDLQGVPMLRSFQDYRFRAPNLVALNIEHEHDIVGVLGSLLFVDVGRVSETPATFTLRHLHRSFGAGLTARLGNATFLRLFYAWGGGEGTRTSITGSTDSFFSR
jgi:hypothetical protein